MTIVTMCPPAHAHQIESPEPQFSDRHRKPVSVEFDGEGDAVSTGLAFDDYARMTTIIRRPTARRKPIPVYATNPASMRALLVRYMEARAFGTNTLQQLTGSHAQRLRRAHDAIVADVPRLDALVNTLCNRYMAARRDGAPDDVLRRVRIEIEGVDAQIRMAKDLPAIVVGIIYRSYCLSEPSNHVASAFGLQPPAIRMLLHRLALVWKRIKDEEHAPNVIGLLPKTPPEKLERCRKNAVRWFANLTPEEKEARRKRVNVTSAAWLQEKRQDPAWREMRNAAGRAARLEAAIGKAEGAN